MSAPQREPETWCENCGDAFSAPERDCPNPSPGEPLVDCGRGGHMFRLTSPPSRDRRARGAAPASRVTPPEVGQRCPRCHRRRPENPTLPCALCAPHLVPAPGPLAAAGFRVVVRRRESFGDPRHEFYWLLEPRLPRPPSLAQALEILEMRDAARERGDLPGVPGQMAILGHLRPDGVFSVDRCECGHPAFNEEGGCKLCRALASVHPVAARDAHDLECRYQAAERYLDRVASVVAALKERLQAVPLGGVRDADLEPGQAPGEPQQPPRDA